MPKPATAAVRMPSPVADHLLSRRGLTLTELLVVIGLLAALSAIAISGLFRKKSANALLATEQVLTDMVRQARQTARTSGAPVVVSIEPVDATDLTLGWTVAGVSRNCIWSDSWDDDAGGTRPLPAQGMQGITIGLNGNGLTGISASENGQFPNTHVLLPRDQLVRGKRQDGFYMACAMRLVSDKLLPVNSTTSPLEKVMPLMLLGQSGDDQVTDSLAGMMLLPYRPMLQPAPQAGPQSTGALPSDPCLHCYELIGWVSPYSPSTTTPPPEPTDEVSSIQSDSQPTVSDPNSPGTLIPVPRDQQQLHPSFAANSPNSDAAGPIPLDHWQEVSLLFDGTELTLYRNGQRVGERLYTGPPNSLPSGKDTIFIGQASVPGNGTPIYSGDNVVFDDVRLYRLGTAQVAQLPTGVIATQTYRVTCHPDGRVELAAPLVQIGVRGGSIQVFTPQNSAENISTQARTAMIFTLQMHGEPTHARGPYNAAVITITTSGTVTSSLATWEKSATGVEYPVVLTP